MKKWYALLANGNIVLLGAFDEFEQASDFADKKYGGMFGLMGEGVVWIFDHEGAEQMKDQLKELT